MDVGSSGSKKERKPNMKLTKKILAFVMAMIVITACFVGCASKTGKTMMKLEKTEFSENVFMLYLSRMKGNLCRGSIYGSAALKDSFWDSKWDASGKTYNEYYTEQVLENAKNTLAALYLFEQNKMKLPQETLDAIDAELADLIDRDANGSRSEFDALLADYGANYNVLRESYIIEAKVNYLMNDLLGEDGSLIGKEWLNDYYEENYVRFKQIFFYTSAIQYETDEDGRDIYYTSGGKIAYDTEQKVKYDEDGLAVRDANGDKVYVNEDGTVAYDITKGLRRQIKDSDGNAVREDLQGDALDVVINRSKEVYAKLMEGDTIGFEALLKEYNEDEAMSTYPNGYYMTEDTQYDSPEVVKKLFEMEDGEIAWVRSEYGVHVIMRYELEADGYSLDTNEDFFKDRTTGQYLFMSQLKNLWMNEYLAPYKEKIQILDETIFDEINIKSVEANFYY